MKHLFSYHTPDKQTAAKPAHRQEPRVRSEHKYCVEFWFAHKLIANSVVHVFTADTPFFPLSARDFSSHDARQQPSS